MYLIICGFVIVFGEIFTRHVLGFDFGCVDNGGDWVGVRGGIAGDLELRRVVFIIDFSFFSVCML